MRWRLAGDRRAWMRPWLMEPRREQGFRGQAASLSESYENISHREQLFGCSQASLPMTEARLGGCGPVNVRAGPHLGGGPDCERPAPTLPVRPSWARSATASACGGHSLLPAGGRPLHPDHETPCTPIMKGASPLRRLLTEGRRKEQTPLRPPRAVAEVSALRLLWQAAQRPRCPALWLRLEPCGCRGQSAPRPGRPGNLRWQSSVVGSKIMSGGHATRGRLQLNRGMTGFDFGG